MSDYDDYTEDDAGKAKKGLSPLMIGGIIAAVVLIGGGAAAGLMRSGGSEAGASNGTTVAESSDGTKVVGSSDGTKVAGSSDGTKVAGSSRDKLFYFLKKFYTNFIPLGLCFLACIVSVNFKKQVII